MSEKANTLAEGQKMKKEHSQMNNKHYGRLLIMAACSFLSMYVLMYAMVNALNNVFPNFNQFYMAGLMTAAMIVIELLLMGSMYANKKRNIVITAGSVLAGILFLDAYQTSSS
jgi:hypothetical protein